MASEFIETFTSPFEKDTEEEALQVLDDIRSTHPMSCGWVEIYGRAVSLPNGKFVAVRKHIKVQVS